MAEITYKNISQCLHGFLGSPWDELPEEQRVAWREAILFNEDYMDAKLWSECDAQGRAKIAAQFDAQNDPALESERFVAEGCD